MRHTIFPIVLIILGIAWLLDSFNWLLQVHWLRIFAAKHNENGRAAARPTNG